jgi:hypothetical protein
MCFSIWISSSRGERVLQHKQNGQTYDAPFFLVHLIIEDRYSCLVATRQLTPLCVKGTPVLNINLIFKLIINCTTLFILVVELQCKTGSFHLKGSKPYGVWLTNVNLYSRGCLLLYSGFLILAEDKGRIPDSITPYTHTHKPTHTHTHTLAPFSHVPRMSLCASARHLKLTGFAY